MVDQLRHFVFTYHLKESDIDIEIRDRIRGKLDSWGGVRYMCIGSEMGASGKRPHLQGYVQLTKRKSFKLVGAAFPWHIENALGSAEENQRYCAKEDGHFWEYGKMKETVSAIKIDYKEIIKLARAGQVDLIEAQFPAAFLRHRSCLLAMALEVENPFSYERNAIWLVGGPGTGKTRFAHALDTDVYFKNPNRWFDGYHSNAIVCVDDVDSTNFVGLSYWLKRWGDRYPILGERKHGSLYLKHQVIVVTSNYRIDTLIKRCGCDEELAFALHRRFKEVVVLDHRETPIGQIEIKTPDRWLNNINIFKNQ